MASPDQRDTDLSHLHPVVRLAATQVVAQVNSEGHPFKIFEAFRTPQRQAHLYAQGRTRPGAIVTNARPWTSYHQYGLAVDLVLFMNGGWSWNTGGALGAAWTRMQEVGRQHGLEPLSWEKPHLQIAGVTIDRLKSGQYPAGGDDSWAENLEGAIAGWNGSPSAPPPPAQIPARPPLENFDEDTAAGAEPITGTLPPVGHQDWHSVHGGRDWKYDGSGVYTRTHDGGGRPLRSPGQPITCRAIWDLFSVQIATAAQRYGIAPELIIMTIATEAAAYRPQNFTGPATFRWEAHVWNEDVDPRSRGDYSAGPMQTLGTTARWVIQAQSLPYHRFQVAPVYTNRPIPAPAAHPLYDASINIDIGTAEIKQRLGTTGPDPILVAAAFNSGGVYSTTTNAWHLRSHGNHIDRAAQWFGDACAVLKEAGVR